MNARPVGMAFWQPCLSPHQAPYLRALGDRGIRITAVVEERLPAVRRDLGWLEPDYGRAEILVAPDARQREEILRRKDWIHVFTPARAYPMVRAGFVRAAELGVTIGIFSEAYRFFGAEGLVRRVRGHFDALRYRNSVSFVLAVGHLGVRWYQSTGFDARKVYSFGYITERPGEVASLSDPVPTGPFRVLYVGRLHWRKRVDLLLRALARVEASEWTLQIVGDGVERRKLDDLIASDSTLRERVEFLGKRPGNEVGAVIRGGDLLVLPSAWDGWGAVVNEALMEGIPAVCSDRCGAADLLGNPAQGDVFRYPSIEQLAGILSSRIGRGRQPNHLRCALQDWSEAITGDAAADYVLEVVRHAHEGGPRPVAPWFRDRQENA